jgi:hypothetical protein
MAEDCLPPHLIECLLLEKAVGQDPKISGDLRPLTDLRDELNYRT